MAICKTEGIIIRSQHLRESSKLITAYTLDFGKVKLTAKGCKSFKSRFGGSIDLLNHVALVMYYKETRPIQLLSQSEIIHSWERIRTDLEKLTLALAICELIDKAEIGNAPNKALFHTAVATLEGLDQSNHATNYFSYFVIKFLEITGFKPNLEHCRSCGGANPAGSIVFKISKGGFLCSRCRVHDPSGLRLSSETVQILRRYQKASPEHIDSLRPSSRAQQEITQFIRAYMNYHLEYLSDLNSLRFLAEIKPQLERDCND